MAAGKEMSRVEGVRVLALKGMLKLETKGLTRRGRSAYSIVKSEFGFRGNKEKVLAQLDKWCEENLFGQDDDLEAKGEE